MRRKLRFSTIWSSYGMWQPGLKQISNYSPVFWMQNFVEKYKGSARSEWCFSLFCFRYQMGSYKNLLEFSTSLTSGRSHEMSPSWSLPRFLSPNDTMWCFHMVWREACDLIACMTSIESWVGYAVLSLLISSRNEPFPWKRNRGRSHTWVYIHRLQKHCVHITNHWRPKL